MAARDRERVPDHREPLAGTRVRALGPVDDHDEPVAHLAWGDEVLVEHLLVAGRRSRQWRFTYATSTGGASGAWSRTATLTPPRPGADDARAAPPDLRRDGQRCLVISRRIVAIVDRVNRLTTSKWQACCAR
jgi:hypothetical protein